MKLQVDRVREVMRLSTGCFLLILFAGMTMVPELKAQPNATNEWVDFYSEGGLTINGSPAPAGTIIQAYDPDGVLCGEFVVESPGDYGLMPVYRDDENTDIDEGAEPGDTITFKINGETATPNGPGDPEWTSNGETIELDLSIEGPELDTPAEQVDFGTVEIGSGSASTISLSNSGTDRLSFDSIKVDYRFPSFIHSELETNQLNEGESGNLELEFNPEFSSGVVEGYVLLYSNAVNHIELAIPFRAEIESDITPTNEWVSFYSEKTSFGEQPVKQGDIIDAYDPDGVHVGSFTVENEGSYGLMEVYGDDPNTEDDEGAETGDEITFTINGMPAEVENENSPEWAHGETIEIDLKATPNQPPVIDSRIEDFEMDIPDPEESFNLADNFSDPENGALKFFTSADNEAVNVSLEGNTLTVSSNEIGETTIEVIALDEFYKTARFSFTIEVIDTPPNSPETLDLVQDGNTVVINWAENSEDDLEGYHVYRSTSQDFSIENATQLSENLVSSTSFTDEGVSEDNYYYYKVTAVDENSNESEGSQERGLYYITESNLSGAGGWNLISLPLSIEEENYLSIFPDAVENTLYLYSGGYQSDSLITANKGYWIKNSTDFDIDLEGESIHSYSVDLSNGWNIIGALSDTVDNNSVFSEQNDNVLNGTFWTYTEGTLQVTDSFIPGKGYFVKTSSAGAATFSLDFAQNQNKTNVQTRTEVIADFDEVIISSDDIEKSLYVDGMLPGGWNSANFEVPPAPPSPSLDVRFANDLYLVEEDSSKIFVQSEDYPITLSLDSDNASHYIISEYNDDQIKQTYQLSGETSVTIDEPVEYLGISKKKVSDTESTPTSFKLSPNYPNPFNPTTQIQYSIAEVAEVKLEVFNILGRRVRTLVNEQKEPGNYEVTFDGSDLASGIYLYRLQAGDYVSTKKFILAK